MRRLLSGAVTVLVIAGVTVVMLFAVAFISTSDGSQNVAREGNVALAAEATLSQAVVTWNTAVQTVVLEAARADGAPTIVEVARSSDLLEAGVREYERRAEHLASSLPLEEQAAVVASTADLSKQFWTVIVALDQPPVAGVSRVTAPATEAYTAAAGDLVAIRDARVSEVLVEAEYAGQAADALRFMVTIAIPIAALFLLRRVMRRRREREAMQAELTKTQSVLDSKDEFVANLSHELRTPLTGVYGFALALEEGGADDPETARELASLIAQDASELSRMVDDLITAGQVETGNIVLDIEDIEIDPEIEGVVEPFIRSGAAITFDKSGDVAVADRLRFRQIVRNLVSNAVRHGGPNIEVFSEYGGGFVSVFVMDDGDGIADENVTQIFERYQHEGSRPLLQGSVGLGLAIARSLAAGMGGDLTYTRTNGLTYFVLRLPSHRVGKLNERVEDQALGDESAAMSASEIAKLFSR